MAAVALSSCSFALAGPSSDWRPSHEPDCDRSKSAVGIDGVWAGVGGLVAIAGLVNDEPGVGVAGLLVGVLFAGAAYRGNSTVDACRAADRGHQAWLAGQRSPVADDETRSPPRRTFVPRIDDTALIEPTTSPPTSPPLKEPAASPKPTPPRPASTDEWDDFWREVP